MGAAAKRQPSVRTDDSAAEVRLEYLPTHSRGQLERRRKARTAASLAKMTTQRHTHKPVRPSDHQELSSRL